MNMSTMDHFILILLSMLVAFGPRFIPLRIFSTREIPKWFNEWMKYVPVSLFTALDSCFRAGCDRCLSLTFNGPFRCAGPCRRCIAGNGISNLKD